MELWEKIKDWELYEISNQGRIKRNSRYLKMCFDGDGYNHVTLSKNGWRTTKKIHRLVIEAFTGKDITGKIICHIDGDKTNNRLDNLYVGNLKSNTLDKYKHGSTKLTIEQTIEIKNMDGTHQNIANQFGVSQATITRIKNGTRSKYITQQ